ncbi:MAG: kelch repeat-containing protein [Planctomycetota bacterium]|jgi:hypothetical protein
MLRRFGLLCALAPAALLPACGDADDAGPSPLHVASVVPADGALGVSTTGNLTITFTVAVAPETVEGTGQILLVNGSNNVQAAVVEVDPDDPTIVTVNPTVDFDADATYGLAIRNGVATPAGRRIAAPMAVTFSTGQVLTPIPGFPPFDDAAIAPSPPGSFTAAAGTMLTARRDAAAALLADGRVFIHGGRDLAGNPISSTELFSFADTKFTATATIGATPAARWAHTATRLADARVLVAGGRGAASILGDTPLYVPSTTAYAAPVPSLNTPRAEHSAVLLANGQVLVAGGTDGTNVISVCELFNPATGTWTTTGSLGTARTQHAAVRLADNRVLVCGGSDGTSTLAASEIYDPATGTWTGTSNLTTARQGHTATLLSSGAGAGFVVVAGGWATGAPATTLSSAEAFDPAGNSGAGNFQGTTTGMGTARTGHTATFLPATGELFVAGGSTTVPPQVNGACSALASAERFDPAGNAGVVPGVPALTGFAGLIAQGTWTVTQDADGNQTFMSNGVTAGRANHVAALLGNGTVLLAGGLDCTSTGTSGNLRVLDTAERFTP